MTHFADHGQHHGHDSASRFLARDKLTGRIVRDHVSGEIAESGNGFLVFDDTVIDKNHSHNMEMVRRQYGGNAHGLMKGIAMVNCPHINPDINQYRIVDCLPYDPDNDGKSEIRHVREMLTAASADKCLAFSHVPFDSWYATKELMLLVHDLKKHCCCPLKGNRLVDDGEARRPYIHASEIMKRNYSG